MAAPVASDRARTRTAARAARARWERRMMILWFSLLVICALCCYHVTVKRHHPDNFDSPKCAIHRAPALFVVGLVAHMVLRLSGLVLSVCLTASRQLSLTLSLFALVIGHQNTDEY